MKKFFEKINVTLKQLIDIFLIVLLLIFIFQNIENVQVRFLFFKFESPLIVIIAITFFIGFYTSRVFSKKSNEKTIKKEN